MDENVTECYFYILSFPERKYSGGSGISYIITMAICFSWNFKVLLKNKEDIDQNVFLLVFEMP